MKAGIIGLGLIGGSMARALKASGTEILGYDTEMRTLQFAQMLGCCDDVLTEKNMGECDCLFLAIPPHAAEDWLTEHAEKIGRQKNQPLIMDCCGVKRQICELGFRLEETEGIRFVSIHPMAGRETWGLRNSDKDLFNGALCAIIPNKPDRNDPALMASVKKILQIAGFTRFTVMTPEEHDKVIALTSQLSHVVSSSFVKCDDGIREEAVTAGGSFRDMTRVAYLNEHIWSELFLENRDNLLSRLDLFIGELEKYRVALASSDRNELTGLLAKGREEKEFLTSMAKRV